jgi:hypothetical protein
MMKKSPERVKHLLCWMLTAVNCSLWSNWYDMMDPFVEDLEICIGHGGWKNAYLYVSLIINPSV